MTWNCAGGEEEHAKVVHAKVVHAKEVHAQVLYLKNQIYD